MGSFAFNSIFLHYTRTRIVYADWMKEPYGRKEKVPPLSWPEGDYVEGMKFPSRRVGVNSGSRQPAKFHSSVVVQIASAVNT